MNWKGFLKPDKEKIIVFVIFVFIFLIGVPQVPFFLIFFPPTFYLSFFVYILGTVFLGVYLWTILFAFLYYLISCCIVSFWGRKEPKWGLRQKAIIILIIIVANYFIFYSLFYIFVNFSPPIPVRLGDFATAQAEQGMLSNFSNSTNIILATIPEREKFPSGSEIWFKIGIKKTKIVKDYEFFALCIETEGSGCIASTGSSFVAVGNEGISFKFIPVTRIEEVGDKKLLSALMKITEETNVGIHNFRIYVCAVEYENHICVPEDSQDAYEFIVEVK